MANIFLITILLSSTPLNNATIPDFDCDAPRGYYDQLRVGGAENGFRVSGFINLGKLKRGRNWLPAVSVVFQKDKHTGLGLQFWQASADELNFGLREPGSATPAPLGILPLDKRIQFIFAMSKDRLLEFAVNDRAFQVPDVKVSPSDAVLTCSGGHVVFENLSIESF